MLEMKNTNIKILFHTHKHTHTSTHTSTHISTRTHTHNQIARFNHTNKAHSKRIKNPQFRHHYDHATFFSLLFSSAQFNNNNNNNNAMIYINLSR